METYSVTDINNIYQDIESGNLCYYHKPSKSVYSFINWNESDITMKDELRWCSTEEQKLAVKEMYKIIKGIEKGDADFILIEGATSSKKFEIMENFVLDIVDSNPTKQLLINALNNSKPFMNFKRILNNTDALREEWFAFNNKCLEQYVEIKIAKIVNFY